MQALKIIDIQDERPVLALELPDGTTFGEWLAIGRRLRLGSQALNWHIGDWWKFGVSHWGEEETRKSAMEIWGVEGETARVYGWVATKFDPVNRLTDLTFTHYQRAASLPIDDAKKVIAKASAESLTVREVVREVQALKAANDPERSRCAEPVAVIEKSLPPQSKKAELTTAYEMVIEFAEALQQLRPLSRRETDLLALAETFVDEARAGHRQCPDDFEIIFVEKGRLACEEHYQASRLTVNRWLIQRGKSRLINKRAEFVRFQRDQLHPQDARPEEVPEVKVDPVMFALAREAASFLRVSRYGGWTITYDAPIDRWLVGTVRKTSDELIAMAERQGFDSAVARTEIDAE